MNLDATELFAGCHLGGFQEVIEVIPRIQQLGGRVVQIFLSPPIGKPSAGKYRQLQVHGDRYRAEFAREGIRLFVHAPYTLNFAKALDGPEHPYWIDALTRELEMASFVGAEGVVLHVGKRLDLSAAAAEENMFRGLQRVLARAPAGPLLLLETAAGQGTELFVDPRDLARFAARLREAFPGRVALCFDTAHAFAAGQTASGPGLSELHRICPIGLVHMNDSRKPRGSRVDRHEVLGMGLIPVEEMAAVVRWARGHGIACVLETTNTLDGHRQEIEFMREMSH